MQNSLGQPRARRTCPRPQGAEAQRLTGRSDGATCSVRVIHPFARYLAQIGHDHEAWLRPYGLTIAGLRDRDLRIPHGQAAALLRDAVAISGDPAIGLRAARCAEPGDFDVLEYAAANCASVGESFQLAARFIALLHDGLSMELELAPPLAALRVRPRRGCVHEPAGIELLLASLLAYSSRSVGYATPPLRVELVHAAPADISLHEQTFGEVQFGSDAYAMWIDASALELPHCAPDRSLLEILTDHADGLLRRLPTGPHGFAERTSAAISATLLAGQSRVEQVARRLAVSLRTLHRRLAEEGTSHGELLDEVRRTQAILHLRDNRFSIGEISFLLGFSHANSLHKAFKRWTGITPAQFRDQSRLSGLR